MILVLNLDNVLLNGVTRLFDQAVLEETEMMVAQKKRLLCLPLGISCEKNTGIT